MYNYKYHPKWTTRHKYDRIVAVVQEYTDMLTEKQKVQTGAFCFDKFYIDKLTEKINAYEQAYDELPDYYKPIITERFINKKKYYQIDNYSITQIKRIVRMFIGRVGVLLGELPEQQDVDQCV